MKFLTEKKVFLANELLNLINVSFLLVAVRVSSPQPWCSCHSPPVYPVSRDVSLLH